MKQYALILFSAALALSGCGDNPEVPAPAAPATEASSDNPLSGVWVDDEQVLVLERNGDFYLPNDPLRQGLSWEQQGDTFTFRFLDSNALSVEQRTLNGQQQDDTLTLSAPAEAVASGDDNEEEEQDAENTALFAGNFERDSTAVGYLSGQVQLPENASLPEQAVLTVALLADDDIVLRRVIRLNGADNLYPFRLYYPAAAVEADKQYQLDTQILAGGGVFYRSDSTELTRSGDGFADITLPLDPVMIDSETLRGAVVWQADGPAFLLCNSDQRLQVNGPQGPALLNDIRTHMAYPQQPRIATVSGVRRKIPGEQEGSTQAAVAVESYSLAALGDMDNCQIPAAELANTRWVLSHLGKEKVDMPEDMSAPHLLFSEGQARGNGGCNSFQGGYQQEGAALSVKPLTSTEKACPALKTEQAFHQALADTDHYRIDGQLLTLFDSEDQPVASFMAVYL